MALRARCESGRGQRAKLGWDLDTRKHRAGREACTWLEGWVVGAYLQFGPFGAVCGSRVEALAPGSGPVAGVADCGLRGIVSFRSGGGRWAKMPRVIGSPVHWTQQTDFFSLPQISAGNQRCPPLPSATPIISTTPHLPQNSPEFFSSCSHPSFLAFFSTYAASQNVAPSAIITTWGLCAAPANTYSIHRQDVASGRIQSCNTTKQPPSHPQT